MGGAGGVGGAVEPHSPGGFSMKGHQGPPSEAFVLTQPCLASGLSGCGGLHASVALFPAFEVHCSSEVARPGDGVA